MTRKLVGAIAAGVFAGLLSAGPVMAHHAFSAEFDANRPVKLEGAVTKVELVNPHAWIHMAVTCTGAPVKAGDPICAGKAKGESEEWMVEGGTPNTLQRRGITRDSIKVGTVIVVEGYQAKDGTLKANGRNLTFPDGRTMFMGSSGTGAPQDGRDPGDKK